MQETSVRVYGTVSLDAFGFRIKGTVAHVTAHPLTLVWNIDVMSASIAGIYHPQGDKQMGN